MRTKKLFFAAVAVMLCALMIVAAPVAYARDYAAQTPSTDNKSTFDVPADGKHASVDVLLEGDNVIKAKEDQALELNIWVENIEKIKEIFFEVSSEAGEVKWNGACVRYLLNSSNKMGQLKNGWNKIQFILHKSTGLASGSGDAKSKSFNTRYSFYLGGGMTGNVDYNNIIYLRLVSKTDGSGAAKIGIAGEKLNDAITLIDKPDQSYVPELDSSVPDVSSNTSSKGGYLLTPSTAASSEEAVSSEAAVSSEVEVTSVADSSVVSEADDEGGSFPWWIIAVVVVAVAVAGVAVVLVLKKKKA